MDRTQLLSRVDDAWRAFARACEGLSPEDLSAAGVTGPWSAKDLMGHVATWETEALAALPVVVAGGRLPRYSRYGGIDAFNDMKWKQLRGLSLEETRSRFVETHARLLTYLAEVPVRLYAQEGRFRRRLRLDTYGHYPEHTRQVAAWRKARHSDTGNST